MKTTTIEADTTPIKNKTTIKIIKQQDKHHLNECPTAEIKSSYTEDNSETTPYISPKK